jgi:hypothetical protein
MKGGAREKQPPPGVEKSMLNFDKKRVVGLLRVSEPKAIKKYASFLFAIILGIAAVQKWLLLSSTNGGGEIMSTYIPKTLMLLHGQNPYSTEAWAAPYPPFMFIVLGGIIRVTTWNTTLAQDPISLLARNIRLAGLVADLLVAVLIFLALKAKNKPGLQSLLPPAVFLLLPSLGSTNYYWFHGDVFGYLILAASLLAFVKKHMLIGLSLLSLAVVFKLQPILSLPLIAIWAVKRGGFFQTLPSLISSLGILVAGLVLPLWLPSYLNVIIGFNMSYGAGNGTASFTLMNLFNGALPALGVAFSSFFVNEAWIAATIALFTVALGVVWTRARSLDPVDVVVLGLLAWLIPLRTLYPYYLVWAFIPFFFKGSIRQMIALAAMFETATTLAVWSWNIPPNPFPEMSSVYGYLITSLAFAAWSVVGTVFVLKGLRDRSSSFAMTLSRVSSR